MSNDPKRKERVEYREIQERGHGENFRENNLTFWTGGRGVSVKNSRKLMHHLIKNRGVRN